MWTFMQAIHYRNSKVCHTGYTTNQHLYTTNCADNAPFLWFKCWDIRTYISNITCTKEKFTMKTFTCTVGDLVPWFVLLWHRPLSTKPFTLFCAPKSSANFSNRFAKLATDSCWWLFSDVSMLSINYCITGRLYSFQWHDSCEKKN